LETRFC